MAIISRPGKEGNATTYQGKVAAGYANILAQEVDADIDAIFSAWNAGVDTVNIKPGAVGPAQIAPGAVGVPALAVNAVTAPAIAPGAVTTVAILDGTIQVADMAPALQGPLQGNFPGGGNFGGELNATLALILNPRAAFAAQPDHVEITGNLSGVPGYDNTAPTWIVRLWYEAAQDFLEIARVPVGGGTPVQLLYVNGAGRTSCNLIDGAIRRNHIYPNAPIGAVSSVGVPPGFALSTPNVWTPYATLPAMTTRGGWVFLGANPLLAASGPAGGAILSQRWLRDGSPIYTGSQNISGSTLVPVPGLQYIDGAAPAGSHIYSYQIMGATGVAAISNLQGDGGFWALEVG